MSFVAKNKFRGNKKGRSPLMVALAILVLAIVIAALVVMYQRYTAQQQQQSRVVEKFSVPPAPAMAGAGCGPSTCSM